MLYAHARICSILRNADVDMAELRRTGKIELAHPAEVALAMHMLRFPEVRKQYQCAGPNGVPLPCGGGLRGRGDVWAGRGVTACSC